MSISIGQLRSAMFKRETEKAQRIEEKLEADAIKLFNSVDVSFQKKAQDILDSDGIVYELSVRVTEDDLEILERTHKMLREQYPEFNVEMRSGEFDTVCFIFNWKP